MYKVGLTGGIASGKTAATDCFEALGVAVVDADRVARIVVAPGQSALADISAQFGPTVIAADGQLNRAELRKLIFSDNKKRQWLEQLLHPRIRAEMARQTEQTTGSYCILSIPLLVESQLQNSVDRILVIDVSERIQLSRLQRRDGCTETEARTIMATQTNRETRLAAADDIIDNSLGLDALQQQVEKLHRHYLELSTQPKPVK